MAPDDPSQPAVETLSFEEALRELEEIVRRLEKGDASLEAAITSYTRGNALRGHCERKLAEAEQRVQAIVPGPGGPTLREADA
ncbi:exodeoxyribonuclease VII small subunit [Roseomonas sp. BN140053]|uniref:exodeoxyribonuclease VII small subunit n=1 Tax=Roseomonas sp. BN140053 TaxID=3391898 RepID=UPI0039E753E1